jgi:hypothetical protein
MKKPFSLAVVAMLSLSLAAQSPTSNPLEDYYGQTDGFPAWSSNIRWDNVIDMSQYSNGTTNFEKFENARDALFAQGGGVLYYPAGVYEFDVPDGPNGRGLMLKSGVVIRGELPPASDRKAVTTLDRLQITQHGLNSNPTKFRFTRLDFTDSLPNVDGPDEHKGKIPKMWNMIGCTPANANYVGIVWVEIEYGYIYFGFDIDTQWAQWRTHFAYAGLAKGNWINRVGDGTHPLDVFMGTYEWGQPNALMGSNRFVFGTHLKNSTIPNYAANKGPFTNSWKVEHGGWQFGARMGVNGRHIFLANNCISKPTAWFYFDQEARPGNGFPQGGFVRQVYEYSNCLGIDVNKSLMSGIKSRCVVTDSNGFYANDIFIKENWVYNHGNKNYEAAGKWVLIKDNVASKDPINRLNIFDGTQLAAVVHKSSYKAHAAVNAEDYMNRAFDYGGWNVWFDNNRFQGTGSIGNDGEGILCQRHGGVEAYSITMTNNEQGPTGQNGYLAPYDVTVVGLFHAWNNQRGNVGIAKVEANYICDVSVVRNVNNAGNPSAVAGQTGTRVMDFLNQMCPAGSFPTAPVISLSRLGDAVQIEWNNVPNEVGYAVQRRRLGDPDWRTIVYRPRQETGGLVTFSMGTTGNNIGTNANYGPQPTQQCWDGVERNMNEPKWLDYTTLTGTFEYRVIALVCEQDGIDGAIGESDTITVITGMKGLASKPVRFVDFKLYPNPTSGNVVNLDAGIAKVTALNIYDQSGKLVQSRKANKTSLTQINTKGMKPGIYYVEVQTHDGATKAKMVVQ